MKCWLRWITSWPFFSEIYLEKLPYEKNWSKSKKTNANTPIIIVQNANRETSGFALTTYNKQSTDSPSKCLRPGLLACELRLRRHQGCRQHPYSRGVVETKKTFWTMWGVCCFTGAGEVPVVAGRDQQKSSRILIGAGMQLWFLSLFVNDCWRITVGRYVRTSRSNHPSRAPLRH